MSCCDDVMSCSIDEIFEDLLHLEDCPQDAVDAEQKQIELRQLSRYLDKTEMNRSTKGISLKQN